MTIRINNLTPEERERMNATEGWFYCAEFAVFGGIRYLVKDQSPEWLYGIADAWIGNIYGPFKTFSEARKDALAYFRSDLIHTRIAIREVLATKKGKKE